MVDCQKATTRNAVELRVSLGPISENDCEEICAWKNDSELSIRMAATPLPQSREQVLQWLRAVQADKNQILFGIRLTEDGRLIGIVRFMNIDWISRVAEFGMYIGNPSERGKSLGRATIEVALIIAFVRLNLHRIWLRVLDSNKVAYSLYKSVGFENEGLLREHFFADGSYHSMTMMALLAKNFEASSSARVNQA